MSDADALHTTLRTPAGEVGVHVWPAADETANRPVLLALHGWTGGGIDFTSLVAGPHGLGRRWTVLAVDAPAHGRTRWPQPGDRREEYVVARAAEQAAAVLDTLPSVAGRRAPVVVLGHSMGGVTAARVAALRPDVVVHVVLEDPARTVARAVRNPVRWRQRLALVQSLTVAEREALVRAENPVWDELAHQTWAIAKGEVDPAHLRVPIEWGEPLVALLADVAAPVTLIHGVRSRGAIVSPAAARRCAAACRAGCEVIELDAGHSVRRDAPGPFTAALAAALGRHEH